MDNKYPIQTTMEGDKLQFHIVDHLHGEHKFEGYKIARLDNIFDGMEADKYFTAYFESSDLKGTALYKKVRSATALAYEKLCKHHLLESDNDTQNGQSSTIVCIHVRVAQVDHWLAFLESDVESAIINSSGDDDFYDYMPNFVNIFRQVCILVGQPERYNKLLTKVGPLHIGHDEEYEFYHESA
tara:strand:- start:100 stop:651 length:552 start_codon:yes stop_codon:yes gene_type:complete